MRRLFGPFRATGVVVILLDIELSGNIPYEALELRYPFAEALSRFGRLDLGRGLLVDTCNASAEALVADIRPVFPENAFNLAASTW